MKWRDALRRRIGEQGGYTLIWVLLLSTVLVTLVSSVIYATSYGLTKETSAFRNDTAGQYQSDVKVQSDYTQLEQQITAYLNQQTNMTTPGSVATALQGIIAQLQGEGYTVTVTGSYTDANGNLHEILQVTENGSSINLDVTMTPNQVGPSQPQTNPYPYTQYSGQYVADGNTTNQSTISQLGSGSTQPYIVVQSNTPGGTPSSLTLNGGTQLTYGADGNMAELVTGDVNLNTNTGITVDGTLDSSNVTINGGSTATVTGDVIAQQVTLNSGATLNVSGQLTVDSLVLDANSKLSVGGQVYDGSSLTLNSNANLTITHDATISGGISLNGTTNLTIDGNLYETGNVTLNSNTTLHVLNNADITGSITGNKSTLFQVDQSLCVSGTMTLNTGATVKVKDAALIQGGVQGYGGPFTYGSYSTTGTCPIPTQGGYTVTSVTEV